MPGKAEFQQIFRRMIHSDWGWGLQAGFLLSSSTAALPQALPQANFLRSFLRACASGALSGGCVGSKGPNIGPVVVVASRTDPEPFGGPSMESTSSSEQAATTSVQSLSC